MASLLPSPLIPQIEYGNYTNGYAQGDAMRKRNVLLEAGALAAGGNRGGAANALLQGGELSAGMGIQDKMRAEAQAAKAAGVAREKEKWGVIGDLARAANTPEKWTRAIAAAKSSGLDVTGLDSFDSRDLVLARSGRMAAELESLNKEEKPIEVGGSLVGKVNGQYQTLWSGQQAGTKPIEIGGTLVQPTPQPDGSTKYTEVYRAPPKPVQLTAVDKKELYEADEGAQAGNSVIGSLNEALKLNQQAYYGPTAALRGYAGSIVGLDDAVATEDLDNLITNQALENLKATFGGMPTEGERKILLEIQGSSSKSPKARENIYKRAKALAERRVKFNQEKAGALRSGNYFDPNYSPTGEIPTVPSAARIDLSAGRPTANNAGPAIGAVEDGYRYRGGNPANPESWEPAN